MIFTPEHVSKILAGDKTMTRRPVKLGEFGEVKRTYRVGQTYRLQKSREWTSKTLKEHQRQCAAEQPTRARAVLASIDDPLDADHPRGRATTVDEVITVLEVRRERLGEISGADLRREGIPSRPHFETIWSELHGRWTPDLEVWVIKFHVGPPSDQLRLLPYVVGEPGLGDEGDGNYTSHLSLAMGGSLDPGEALRDDEYETLGAAAERRHGVLIRTERAHRGTSDLIAELEARAFEGDEEAQRHLFVINQRLDKAFRNESREAA